MASNPDPTQSNFRADHLGRAFELIAAVAKRDADPHEIVAQLRDQGIDSLDVLVAVLSRAARQTADRRTAERPIDVRQFSEPTPRKLIEQIAHQEPKIPFVLNGTLYMTPRMSIASTGASSISLPTRAATKFWPSTTGT